MSRGKFILAEFYSLTHLCLYTENLFHQENQNIVYKPVAAKLNSNIRVSILTHKTSVLECNTFLTGIKHCKY